MIQTKRTRREAFYAGLYDAEGTRIGGRPVPLAAIDLTPRPRPTPRIVAEPGGRAWFALHTKPQAERECRAALKEAGYETFLPVMRRDIRVARSRRRCEREFILFAGYLFAELPRLLEAWAPVYAIDGIVKALGQDGVPCPLPTGSADEEGTLRYFMAKQAEGMFDETREAKIARGEIVDIDNTRALRGMFQRRSRIRVNSGWLSGFYGHVVNVTGRATVKAMIETLSGLMLVELDGKALELAG